MTILEAIQQANTNAGIETLSFANIQEFQSFQDSFNFSDYPINIVLPFTITGQTQPNGIRKAVVSLQGWVMTRISEDTNDYRTVSVETEYLEPMRDYAISFIKRLVETDIVDNERFPVQDTIRPEYAFLNAHVFGVSYTINLPIIQNVC